MKKKIYVMIKKLQFWCLSTLNKLLVKNKKKIFIEDIACIMDNHYVIFKYLLQNGYNKKYKIIYFTQKKNKLYKQNYDNVSIICGTIKGIYHKITSKYVFYAYGMNRFDCLPSKRQVIFNLWHGSPLKKIGYMKEKPIYKEEKSYTHLLVASDFFIDIMKRAFNCSDEQIFIGGNPRNDLLFTKEDVFLKLCINKSNFKKVICFLPTFRNSSNLNINKFNSEFPLLNDQNIDELNSKLKHDNILLIIKLHHAQVDTHIMKKDYSNIVFIKNHELEEKDVQLYELLGNCDALLTDYSSVFFDFLILDKPIGFVLEDISEYRDKRGFVVDNPLEIMPGAKIYTYECLIKFIQNLIDDNDQFANHRHEVNEIVNKYKYGNCKHILDNVGIKL